MRKFRKFINKHSLQIMTAIFWLSLISAYFYYRNIYQYSDSEIVKKVYFFLKKEGIYGGTIYVSLYVIRTFVFFPSSMLILLSPSLFGLPMAIAYTALGENLSSMLGYYLGKIFGKNIISETYLDRFGFLKKRFREDSFITTLTGRLLFIPFDPLSYISGFFKARFSGYSWGTFFGTLPSILIFAFIGAGIKNIERFNLSDIVIDRKYIIFSTFMIILSLAAVFFIRKLQRR